MDGQTVVVARPSSAELRALWRQREDALEALLERLALGVDRLDSDRQFRGCSWGSPASGGTAR